MSRVFSEGNTLGRWRFSNSPLRTPLARRCRTSSERAGTRRGEEGLVVAPRLEYQSESKPDLLLRTAPASLVPLPSLPAPQLQTLGPTLMTRAPCTGSR